MHSSKNKTKTKTANFSQNTYQNRTTVGTSVAF